MALRLPSITASAAHRTVTLGELRELVEASAHLPDTTLVRGNAIPFHMPDLGHPVGARLQTLGLDHDHDDA